MCVSCSNICFGWYLCAVYDHNKKMYYDIIHFFLFFYILFKLTYKLSPLQDSDLQKCLWMNAIISLVFFFILYFVTLTHTTCLCLAKNYICKFFQDRKKKIKYYSDVSCLVFGITLKDKYFPFQTILSNKIEKK